MNINPAGSNQPINTDSHSNLNKKSGLDSNPDKQKSHQTDSVDISVKNTKNTQASEPPVDSNKVNQIREAIRTGTYQINTDIIANKIMDFEL